MFLVQYNVEIMKINTFLQVSVQSKPNTSSQATKVQMLGPARVSGLRKPKTASSNNENKPVVQATISSLWNNFSFKK